MTKRAPGASKRANTLRSAVNRVVEVLEHLRTDRVRRPAAILFRERDRLQQISAERMRRSALGSAQCATPALAQVDAHQLQFWDGAA